MPSWLDFERFTEWVSGEWWSYLVILAVAAIDAFFPLVPSETLVVIGGNLASSGDLVLWLVILSAAAGARPGGAPGAAAPRGWAAAAAARRPRR